MGKERNPARKSRRRGWRDALRYVVHQRATPEAIARGMAIGLLITFTPTVGIQIPLAILFATLLNANRLSAILPVWLTNVLTVPPTYAFTYWLGAHFVPGKRLGFREVLEKFTHKVDKHFFFELHKHFAEFLKVSRDLLIPMTIGGLIVGAVAAAIGYPLTLRWVRRRRARRSEQIRRRAFSLGGLRRRTPPAETPATESPSPAPKKDDGGAA